MSLASSQADEKNKWIIEAKHHFFWKPSIQRLYSSLKRELDPEYFELIDLSKLGFRLASWNDPSLSALDRIFNLLRKDGFSYTIRFRGVHTTTTAIHLQGYFEVSTEQLQFQQLRASVQKIFREYGCPLNINLGHISIPIVRFKNTFSYQRLPTLDRWEECEFGELRMGQWRVYRDGRTYCLVPLQKFIAHRGNVKGRTVTDENKPQLIETLNAKGVACEVDVWYDGSDFWLGHDKGDYKVTFEWLMNFLPLRLYHCKNRQALDTLHRLCGRLGYEVNLFYHTDEDYVLTSRGHIIVKPDQFCLPDSIEMMPELSEERKNWHYTNVVCSDSEDNKIDRSPPSAFESDSE